jgi:hypothetical protein
MDPSKEWQVKYPGLIEDAIIQQIRKALNGEASEVFAMIFKKHGGTQNCICKRKLVGGGGIHKGFRHSEFEESISLSCMRKSCLESSFIRMKEDGQDDLPVIRSVLSACKNLRCVDVFVTIGGNDHKPAWRVSSLVSLQ